MRAATQSSSAAVKTGAREVVAEHLGSRPRVRWLSALSARAARWRQALAAPRSRWVTAATTRSFLVGKWCSLAPRLTPARSRDEGRRGAREAVLDQQLDGGLQQPRPHGAGPLRLRDTRGGWAGHRPHASDKQTVKPDCL